MIDEKKLGQLLTQSESATLDFKQQSYRFDNAHFESEFIKDIMSMANTRRQDSAFIIIGVVANADGTKKHLGVNDYPDDNHLHNKLKLKEAKVEPLPTFLYYPMSLDGTSYGIIEIPLQDNDNGPFFATRDFGVLKARQLYFRDGSHNREVSIQEQANLYRWFHTLQASSSLSAPLPTVAPSLPPLKLAIAAVEEGRANRESLIKRFLKNFLEELDAINPDLNDRSDYPFPDELLLKALNDSQPLVLDFAYMCEAVATASDLAAARTLYNGFEGILNNYSLPNGVRGTSNVRDFYRFIGHELFVTLFSFLTTQERWAIIADLLNQDFFVENTREGHSQRVSFEYVTYRPLELLNIRNQRLQLNRISLHADLLKERYSTQSQLGQVVPFQQFMDADYFLFLRWVLQGEQSPTRNGWSAWSTLNLYNPPRYLVKAGRKDYAIQLLAPLAVKDVPTLRERVVDRSNMLKYTFPNNNFSWIDPLTWTNYDAHSIGKF